MATKFFEASANLAEVACFHCGLPVPAGTHFSATIFNQTQPMCCMGCQSVAVAIVENGLEDYYKHRTELPKTPEDLVPEVLRQLALYDHPEVQKSFVLTSKNVYAHVDPIKLKLDYYFKFVSKCFSI